MGKKKIFQRHNSLRSVSGNRDNIFNFFRKHYTPLRSNLLGFTLVELLVVFLILGFLIFVAVLLINPLKQLNKVNDAHRQNDIKQIQSALDIYYNDHNCYPQSLSELVPKYMNSGLLKDPAGNGYDYYFMTAVDGAGNVSTVCANRQWYALYAKVNYTSTSSLSCPLEQIPYGSGACVPKNYPPGSADYSGYNYCNTGGKVDCSLTSGITGQTLPQRGYSAGGSTPGTADCSSPSPHYFAVSAGSCNSIGDPSRCSIYNGPLTCYDSGSVGGIGGSCSGNLCSK